MLPNNVVMRWLTNKSIDNHRNVNIGQCENFSMDFLEYIPNGEIVGTDNFDGWDSVYPGHIWIFDGALHYDSESLDGVSDWKDLNIFKRYNNQ